jgi:ribokinase
MNAGRMGRMGPMSGPVVVAGSLNLDLVGRAPSIPAPGETVLGGALARFHGGKGGNQAVAAARLGARVRFFGAVGGDAAGDELLAGLAAEGIDAAGVRRVPVATGAALITVSDAGENAITVLPGANLEAPLPRGAADLRDACCLLLQMEIAPATNAAWAQAARAAAVPVVLNAAPAGAQVPPLLPLADVLLVNESELAQLGGAEAALGPAAVITTLGARGCRVWQRGLQSGQQVAVPGYRLAAEEVVDTTGAGDTFVGALAAALAAGHPLQQAAVQANVAAALSCRRAGARAGMPTRAELEQVLKARTSE